MSIIVVRQTDEVVAQRVAETMTSTDRTGRAGHPGDPTIRRAGAARGVVMTPLARPTRCSPSNRVVDAIGDLAGGVRIQERKD